MSPTQAIITKIPEYKAVVDSLGEDFLDASWYTALGALYDLMDESLDDDSGDRLRRDVASLVEWGLIQDDQQVVTATATELVEPLLYPTSRPELSRYEGVLGPKGRDFLKQVRDSERQREAP